MAGDPYIGVDLKLDAGGLSVTNTGDLDLIGQDNPADNVWQAASLRLTTTLDTYIFALNFGTKMRQFVDEPITDSLLNQMYAEAQATIYQDDRVSSIYNMKISVNTDTDGKQRIYVSFGIITINGSSQYGTASIGG